MPSGLRPDNENQDLDLKSFWLWQKLESHFSAPVRADTSSIIRYWILAD